MRPNNVVTNVEITVKTFNSFLGCDGEGGYMYYVTIDYFQFLSGMRQFISKITNFKVKNFQFLSGMRLSYYTFICGERDGDFQFLSGMRLISWSRFCNSANKILSIPFWDAT